MTQQELMQSNEATNGIITSVRFEHLRDALGIGENRPRLSWTLASTSDPWYQSGYQIESYEGDGRLRERTERIESEQSVLVPWPFAPLVSCESLAVRVRVWDSNGQPSAWSAFFPVEAGLLTPSDWTACFVTPDWKEDTSRAQPASFMRHEFTIGSEIAQARLYITALGTYEAILNGVVIGDAILNPGWTKYDSRLLYHTFDVTHLLHEGQNALGAILADGWYRGRLGFNGGRRNIYGNRLALLAQLEIIYSNGTRERIVTDETWRATHGPILASDLYDGETYDARLELPGWSKPAYDDSDWRNVRKIDYDFTTLDAPSGPPVRRIELLSPIAITSSPSGKTLVDFGQNLVGRLRVTVQGKVGQSITLRHAEVLEHGELGVRPLRLAQATDHYILRGAGVEIWEPRFTFHGFRYAQVEGWPGELRTEDISAVVCHSDLERTGWFECSDALVNRLHENVVWSMRGNFLSIPTDCPQRDERLGWTGDIQVFAPSACFLYDSAGFLTSWLADVALEQKAAEGIVPFVVPNIVPMPPIATAGWGDAAVIVPWVLYQHYRDKGILEVQFESMRTWVDRVADIAGEGYLWEKGFQFGDWLDPNAPIDHPQQACTDPHVVATAYFARSAELLGQAAGVLGRTREEERYLHLAARVRAAFDAEYVTPAGRVLSDAETAYALALQFGLLKTAEQRHHAGQRLVELVRSHGYHISTGFIGTPLVCDALCSAGEYNAAFHLLMQRECPSWLYPVTMGATTIWERWDSLLPDGSVNPGEMTSFNHYALGAIADWLHRTVGGLAPSAPGYRHLEVQPHPGGGLTSARVRHRTPYGVAECVWTIHDRQIEVVVVVPPNTTARVTLPKGGIPLEVGSGTHRWVYPYQMPDPSPRVLDIKLDSLIDDPEAWNTVVKTIREHLSGLAQHMDIRTLMLQNSHMTLEQVLSLLPSADRLPSALESALSEVKTG